MKHVYFLLLFLIPGLYTFAGSYDFSALQGLRDKQGNIYFEISGYDIFCSSMKGEITNSETIAAFKRLQKIQDIQTEYSDSDFKFPNKIIEAKQPTEKNPAIEYNQAFYLFAISENDVDYIVFQTLNPRDISLEKEFINAFLDGNLSEYVSDNWTSDSISFAGRDIQLNSACQWKSPHNLFCKDDGQISWSEFPSAESASADLNAHIAINNGDLNTILSKSYIEVVFEGIPTTAYKVTYMEKNTSYPLTVYYISQKIRNRYVSCIMSNYGYRDDHELAPLFRQFMGILSPPDETAYNKPDTPPQYEETTNDASTPWWNPDIELHFGSVFPLGNLTQIFKYAPSANLFLCFPIKQKLSIDAGFMLSLPVKRHTFDYNYKGQTYKTKTTPLIGASLRYSYWQPLDKDFSLVPYLGVGLFSMTTDMGKRIDKDNQKTSFAIESMDFYGGFQLNYRQLGYFIEYHRTTLPMSYKVSNDFGHSFLNTGFVYYFIMNRRI